CPERSEGSPAAQRSNQALRAAAKTTPPLRLRRSLAPLGIDSRHVLDETRIRLDAIHYVRDLRERWVAVPASEVQQFTSGGERVFLKGQQGIFKPAELADPLSITSTIDSPYTDDPIEGSRVLYDF